MTIFYTIIMLTLSFGELMHSLPQSSVTDYSKLSEKEAKNVQKRGLYRPTLSSFEEYDDDDVQTAAASEKRATTYIDNPYIYQNVIPIKQKAQYRESVQQIIKPKNTPQQFRLPPQQEPSREKDSKELEEEDIEEPDRLSLLLPQSKFVCTNKNTGYYADEDLGCEVFHYCQDNARHSWICPEGFTFHQVHLICMPPGGDNICEKSSQYHFVNDYLYKPVNLEEYQQKPNISLRYSERFYPENYYDEKNSEEGQPIHHRNSVRVNQEVPPVPKSLLVDSVHRPTFRPEASLGQAFRSPNEVNIPLQHRRPQPQQYLTQRFVN